MLERGIVALFLQLLYCEMIVRIELYELRVNSLDVENVLCVALPGPNLKIFFLTVHLQLSGYQAVCSRR